MKKRDVETEEKLSMTRELKFKELQDKIDEEEADRIVEEAIQKSKRKNSNNSVTSELEKEIDEIIEVETKKGRKKKKVEVSDEEISELLGETKKEEIVPEKEKTNEEEIKIKKVNIEEDLYLTSSFKPLKKRFKFSKLVKFLLKLIITLGILGAFVYFILFPLYKMIESSKPKAIFDNSLDYVQEQIYTFIDTNMELDEEVFSFETIVDIDSNIKDMEIVTDNSFIMTYGIDAKNKKFENGLYVENKDKVRHGFTYVEHNTSIYSKYSTSDTVMYEGEVEPGDELFTIEEDSTLLTTDEYKYYVDKIVKTLKEVIDEEDLTATREELTVDGFSVDAVRNSLELDKKKLLKLEKEISTILLKDEKFLEIEAVITDTSLEEVKDNYKTESTYEDDYVLSINIYTTKGYQFVGFDIEENGFRNIYFYTLENKFEAHLNLSEDEECLTGGDCVADARIVIDLIGTTKGNTTKVDIFLNDDDIGSLEVLEFSVNKIDLDYDVILQDIRYEGDFYYEFDKDDKSVEIGASVEFSDEYLRLDFLLTFDTMKDIGLIDKDKVVPYSDKVSKQQVNEFYSVTDKLNMSDSYDLYIEVLSMISTLTEEDETVKEEVNI